MLKRTIAAALITAISLSTVITSAAVAATTVKSGSFRNAGGHKTSGSVRLMKEGGAWKVVFGANFRHDGSPAPRVAFGNGKYVRGTIIGRLKRNKGSQTYTVPKRLNVTKFTQVWIWCVKFNSPLGVAAIR